jgi:AAA+ ATPase superfamily predicted ATPase
LLSQEFKEIKTYFSILNAIAYGNSKPTEIANFVGINTKEIYPYLELLIAYDFVKRETSILGDKKRGIYYINDTFFDFWFNFVQKNREKIDKREYQISKQELSEYMGKRFEIFIRENFSCFINNLSESGRWWHKDKEIDILGLNETKKEILFGECKWSEDADALEIVKECSAKSKYVKWNNDLRKESFAIFAKSFKRKISEFEGKKVFCFDLGDITKLIKHRKTRT